MMLRILAVIGMLTAAPVMAGDGFQRLAGHGGPVKGVAVSDRGDRALTASFDYAVGVWDLESGSETMLYGHDAGVNAAAFLPGDLALSAGDDFNLILWDLRTGAPVHRFTGHKGKILHIAVSPDGRVAATSGWDGWVGLWDLGERRHLGWLKGHKAQVNATAFSGDGTRLYSASTDGTIRVWSVEEAALERVLIKHGFGLNTLVLNEKQGWIAYGAVDGTVRASDLDGERRLADLTSDRRPILAMDLDAERDRLAVGDGEGYLSVIDTQAWRIERDFHAAVRGPIWAVAWTPDGKRLLSSGLDAVAVLWPVAASQEEVAGMLSSATFEFLRKPGEMPNGERQFTRKCSICHTLTPDGANRAGPTLWQLFGRRAGTVAGYPYSDALKGSEIVWSAETVDKLFDLGPDHYTPGSKMPMQRIVKPQDRKDLIAFLRAQTGPKNSGESTK